MIFLMIPIAVIIYLVIGRIIAEKRWEWDGYTYMFEDEGIMWTTIIWPFYLLWKLVKLIA
jgi:hypothetical protein